MKVQILSCPACGADIDYNGRITFCPFCGRKLLVDDEVKRVEINKNININSRHERIERNETRIREAELKKEEKDKEAELQLELKKQDDHTTIKLLVAFFIFYGILGIILLAQEDLGEFFHRNDIQIQTSAKRYRGQNYETVVAELEGLGFENIEVKAVPASWFNVDNNIERISINGNTDFEKDTYFPKDAIILITYYSRDG